MKVRYTPDVFRFQRAGGVSRYFVELARGLQASGVDARIVAGLHINDLVVDAPRTSGVHVGGVGPARARQAVTKAVDHLITGGVVEVLGRGDIVHPTWYPPGLERLPRRARVVTTVFDMIPERFPDLSVRSADATRRKRAWVATADHVLVISESTRRDLVELFGTDPAKVTVTPLGVTVATPTRPAWADGVEGAPFVLYVGDRTTPYKNFARVLDALASPEVDRDLRLVCLGPVAATAEEEADLRRRGLDRRVEVRSGTDGELAWLYSHARALVYPSLYEGFGLPPVEAMACGCPVVASDCSSIPEVVGDAAVLFDPRDTAALASAIAHVTAGGPAVDQLVERGRARSREYTWQATASATLDAYEATVGAVR
jgi:glycosyltransferase involved in cell wall biosynthesis